MLQHSIICKIIQILLCGLHLNWICCTIVNLLTTIVKIMSFWIIAINDPLTYKSTSRPFWNYCYGARHICLKKKHYTILKLVFGMKLIFKFYYSSPQTWKLYVKLLIGLVVYCSTCQIAQATNKRAKANTATKMLQIIQLKLVYSIPAMVETIWP